MNKGNLRQSLMLWGTPDTETDIHDLVERLNNCRKLMDLLIDGKLPLQDYLDLIESQGADMDSYAETTSNNLKDFQLV